MSLTSPKLIVSSLVLALAAFAIASCSQQSTPTAPSAITASVGEPQAVTNSPAVSERVVTLDDEPAPAPAPEPPSEAPPPSGAPAPAPTPAPPPPSGSSPVPWPPGAPPRAAAGVPVPTPPSTNYRVHITIDPEPVRHSGIPLGVAGCPDRSFTWYYDQRLVADTGVGVTFNSRENFFDGRYVNTNGSTIQISGNGTTVLRTRWCSGVQAAHYAQTRFTGKDEYGEAITISGPWVRLLAP